MDGVSPAANKVIPESSCQYLNKESERVQESRPEIFVNVLQRSEFCFIWLSKESGRLPTMWTGLISVNRAQAEL